MLFSRPEQLQTAAWAGFALALLVLLYLLSPILAPFAIAAVFAYICDPAVSWLVSHRVPRVLAVLGVILTLGIGLFVLLLFPVPMVYREALLLAEGLPDLLDIAQQRFSPYFEQQLGISLHFDAASVRGWISEHWTNARDLLPLLLDKLRDGGLALIGLFATLFLIPVVMFYLLQEWPRFMRDLQTVVPRPWLATTLRLLGEVDRVLSEFLRGQLAVMFLLAIFYSLGLWLADLRFALPVGVITGMLVFIPYVGFGTGLLLAVFAAILQGDGWTPLIGVAVVYGLGQLLESFVLTPYLVGERIGLHPLAVIFALMAFGQLFGFVGVLLALPASAALLVGLRELKQLYLASRLYRGAEPGGGGSA